MDERQDFGGTNQMPGLKIFGVVPRVCHTMARGAFCVDSSSRDVYKNMFPFMAFCVSA